MEKMRSRGNEPQSRLAPVPTTNMDGDITYSGIHGINALLEFALASRVVSLALFVLYLIIIV